MLLELQLEQMHQLLGVAKSAAGAAEAASPAPVVVSGCFRPLHERLGQPQEFLTHDRQLLQPPQQMFKLSQQHLQLLWRRLKLLRRLLKQA